MRNLLGLNSVYGQSSLLFVLGIISYLLQFLFTSYLTHQLTPAFYGNFFLALNVLGILTNIFLLGTQTTAVKFMPRYIFLANQSHLDNFLRWIFRVLRISFIICFALALLFAASMSFGHIFEAKSFSSYELYIFMLWVTPFAAFMTLLQNFILGGNHPIVNYLMQNDLVYLLQLILFVLLISVLQWPLTNINITFTLILSYVLLIALGFLFIYRHNTPLFKLILQDTVQHRSIADPAWKKMTIKVILTGIIYTLNNCIDLFILKAVTPYPAHVGWYSVVWVICSLFPLIPQSIVTLILPKIDLYTQPNSALEIRSFQETLNKINRIIFAILGTLTVFIIIFGKPILGLFGSEYIAAYPVLIISVVAALITGIAMPAAYLLLYSSNINTLLFIDILELGLLLILGFLLSIFYDIIGTSIAWLITQCLVAALLIYFARHRTSLKSAWIF